MKSRSFTGDFGGVIEIEMVDQDLVVADISGAAVKEILLRKPNGTLLTKTAEFVSDGTDGKIDCSIASGDFDEAGTWKVQGKVLTAGVFQYSSELGSFRVGSVLA